MSSPTGRALTEFVRKLSAGKYRFYCTCDDCTPDPETFGKWCKNCRGFVLRLGHWA